MIKRPRAQSCRVLLAALLCLLTSVGARAGQTPAGVSAEALRVFLDCGPCDFDHLRMEITFVNYVRDRRDAQVHVLVTTEGSGSGGRLWTLQLIGLEEFAGTDDELEYSTSPTDTDDEEREGFAQILRLGLLRYVARTPLAGEIEIGVERTRTGNGSRMATPEDDPWNFWVFRSRFNTRFNGEESRTSKRFDGSFSANRTTDEWKIRTGINGQYVETDFELSSGSFNNISRNYSLDGRVIKTLGPKTGAGFGGSLVTSTFRNQQLSSRLAPAFEYNFFPYAESTRKQLTTTYAVGFNLFNYEERTIFGRLSEHRLDHSANVSLDFNQPWGDAGFTFEASQFLDDTSQHRVVVRGDIEVRVLRGLSFNISGSSSLIRDQIYLPEEDLTDEEILVRRRQLATDYEYRFSVGFTYSFGSIFNNIVNSRFAGSSGGFIRSF